MQKTRTEIQSDAIYKITTKSGQQCYAVPSDSQPGLFYKTCWNEKTHSWECSCKGGQVAAQRGQSATCKHTRAAQVSVLANKAAHARSLEETRQMDELAQEMKSMKADRLNREEYVREFAIYG